MSRLRRRPTAGLPEKWEEFEHKVTGTRGIDSPAYTFNAAAGTKVTIQLSGESNGVIIVSDSVETLASQNSTTTGVERTTFEVLRGGKHFVRNREPLRWRVRVRIGGNRQASSL